MVRCTKFGDNFGNKRRMLVRRVAPEGISARMKSLQSLKRDIARGCLIGPIDSCCVRFIDIGECNMRCSVITPAFAIYFRNRNDAMGLPAHTHFALVVLEWDAQARVGFPSFEDTNRELHRFITGVASRTFENATNEDVARRLFTEVAQWVPSEVITKYGGKFDLKQLELHVRGVPDHMNHTDGFTIYRIAKAEQL